MNDKFGRELKIDDHAVYINSSKWANRVYLCKIIEFTPKSVRILLLSPRYNYSKLLEDYIYGPNYGHSTVDSRNLILLTEDNICFTPEFNQEKEAIEITDEIL